MPIAENSDGTLWIDINEMAEVEEVQSKLVALGVPVAAVLPDPTCEVIVKEVQWSDTYPQIVPRNGPEPGIVVDPTQIPDGHALLLAVQTMTGPDCDPETVIVLHLIEGSPPSRVARVIGRPLPPPLPGLRRPKPPPAMWLSGLSCQTRLDHGCLSSVISAQPATSQASPLTNHQTRGGPSGPRLCFRFGSPADLKQEPRSCGRCGDNAEASKALAETAQIVPNRRCA
jgi:hypothetical protein